MPDIPTLRRILKTSRVIPVNPSYQEVLGQKCYPSLRDIPGKVEIVAACTVYRGTGRLISECSPVSFSQSQKNGVNSE